MESPLQLGKLGGDSIFPPFNEESLDLTSAHLNCLNSKSGIVIYCRVFKVR